MQLAARAKRSAQVLIPRACFWITLLADRTQMQIAWGILSTCALACIKISAVFFYRRIFCVSGLNAGFNIVTLATAATVSIWLVTFLFLNGFQCGSHLSALWDGTYHQYCTVTFPLLYGLEISDFLLDVWILALPVPQVRFLIVLRVFGHFD